MQLFIALRINGLTKAAKGAASNSMEVQMKLITRFELAAKTKTELYALHRDVFNALVQSKPNTHERRNAMASLENIEREIYSKEFGLWFSAPLSYRL